jgi:hypothetical protein
MRYVTLLLTLVSLVIYFLRRQPLAKLLKLPLP